MKLRGSILAVRPGISSARAFRRRLSLQERNRLYRSGRQETVVDEKPREMAVAQTGQPEKPELKIVANVTRLKPNIKHMLEKIISGGQTGVDRAALDVALEVGIPCGGWCPKGRRAEDGIIPDCYPLQETSSPAYPLRTEMNVEDSDGTLILTWGSPSGGTLLTLKLARKYRKSHILVDLAQEADASSVQEWYRKNQVRIMNVAGPRESEAPGIYHRALSFLNELFINQGSPYLFSSRR